jgi:hypothetical protein
MVFNATYTNISVISWRSALLLEETGGPGEKYRHVSQDTTLYTLQSKSIITVLNRRPSQTFTRKHEK